MKKIILSLILFLVSAQVCGQTYDTVYNRSDELYYSEWYDTALAFWDTNGPCCLNRNEPAGYTPTIYEAWSDYTSRPLQVRGLALMHTINWSSDCYPRTVHWPSGRVPEYIALYQGAGDSLIWLASAQWDTATPQVLKLPKKQDTSLYGFEYCYLYRVYFDKPITVDSVFYIAGSYYNNYFEDGTWTHEPTAYVAMGRHWDREDQYVSLPRYHDKILRATYERGPWRRTGPMNFYYGPFFVIAPDTSCVLELHTADSAMGSVQGGGWYLDSSYITITAVPERGYRFTHWNDGDATNPRTILLTHDTAFTAYFEEAFYTLASNAEPEEGGTVRGGGTYRDGDTATLVAMPNEGYAFVGWHDGDTALSRQLEMTQDTAFTALFHSTQGIGSADNLGGQVRVLPNPAKERVRVLSECGLKGVEVFDAQGRSVLSQTAEGNATELDISQWAAGSYVVRVHTERGTVSRRLVVE
jgi:hypothetical protein